MLRLGLVVFASALACSDSFGTRGPDSNDAGGGDLDGSSPSDGAASEAATISPVTYVRIAQMSPDLGSVDFCVTPKMGNATFGPLVAPPVVDAGSSDAGAPGVGFGMVSRYFPVSASGTMDVAIVSSPATDCSSPRVLGTVTFDPGKHTTIVAIGVAKSSVSTARDVGLTALVDETVGDGTTTRVRFVHAALGTVYTDGPGALSADLTTGNLMVPVAAEVLPRKAATPTSVPPVVDSLGYHALDSTPTGKVGARLSYGSDAGVAVWTSLPEDLSLTVGAIRSAFVVSMPYVYGKAPALGVVVCDDLDQAPQTPCTWLPAY
jgi:hypothetical protein